MDSGITSIMAGGTGFEWGLPSRRTIFSSGSSCGNAVHRFFRIMLCLVVPVACCEDGENQLENFGVGCNVASAL